jgi:ABC-type multidrug transport system fused ATPase/permease subunit
MVIVLGGLTIWLHDETFIKVKPTVYYSLVAALLTFGLATGRPLLKMVLGSTYPGPRRGGMAQAYRNWAIFFAVMAVVNEAVWRNSTTDFWIAFKLWGAIPATLLFAVANSSHVDASRPRYRGSAQSSRTWTCRMSEAIVRIEGLRKAYAGGVEALKGVDLDIQKGEILALLGPNGAGKTTLISIVCGIVTPTTGKIHVGGHDNQTEFRAARSLIGLVPQELTTDAFETVWATVSFSRGLFGKPKDDKKIEEILRRLNPMGQAQREDDGAFRRHEAPGNDRQGALP